MRGFWFCAVASIVAIADFTSATAQTSKKPSPKEEAGAKEKISLAFQVTGFMHRPELAFQLGKKKVYDYDFCEDCWNALKKVEGLSDFRDYSAMMSEAGERPESKPVTIYLYAYFPLDSDLGGIAKSLATAKTAHRSKKDLFLLLHAALDNDAAKLAIAALGKTKGVDAKGSSADARTGQIRARISGSDAVRFHDIVTTLKDAGLKDVQPYDHHKHGRNK